MFRKLGHLITGNDHPAIWIGAYAVPTCGQWVKLGEDNCEGVLETLREKYPHHVEWGIMDTEFLPAYLDENENIHELDYFVELWLELGTTEKVAIQHMGNRQNKISEMVEAIKEETLFDDVLIYDADNNKLEDLGRAVYQEEVEEKVPAHFHDVIDYHQLGHDLKLEGYTHFEVDEQHFWVCQIQS